MTIPTAALTLDDARAIIRGAFDHAAASGFKPLSVAVLDAGYEAGIDRLRLAVQGDSTD